MTPKVRRKHRRFRLKNIENVVFILLWLILIAVINYKFSSYDKLSLMFSISYCLGVLYLSTVGLFYIQQGEWVASRINRSWILKNLPILVIALFLAISSLIILTDNLKDVHSGVIEKEIKVEKRWSSRFLEKVTFVGDNREYNVFASDMELEPSKSYIVHIFPNTGRVIAYRQY